MILSAKRALLKQREEGVKRRIMGVRIEGAPMTPVYTPLDCFDRSLMGGRVGWRKGNRKVGFVTSGVYSPDFDANLGFAMLDIDYAKGWGVGGNRDGWGTPSWAGVSVAV